MQLHACVLMDNHVHLLATPAACGDLSRMMQKLGRQYAGLFNARHQRTGTLWEGRYKACLIGDERYLLACQRYIELNPVRARITEDPLAYRWSSCAAHLGQRSGSMLAPHPAWLALDADPGERSRIWRDLLDEALTEEQLSEIRAYLQQQRAWGRDAFRAMVEAKIRCFAGTRPAHRPSKRGE
ncbi:transposase [Luteimonas deserti]|uniref:transposase n=1 Tax=Luteimonas deserti TaxID=2752306 RepID=UPI002E2E61F5|nr:transposase [Luteimonas deserti]